MKVKLIIGRLMQEKVYMGDLEKLQIKPDPEGVYQFRDSKIQVSCLPSPREGFVNCCIKVELVRRRFPFRKLETVMETGYGVDVYTFRPGLWIDYLSEMSKSADKTAEQRTEQQKRLQEEDAKQTIEANFSPVDDSGLFNDKR